MHVSQVVLFVVLFDFIDEALLSETLMFSNLREGMSALRPLHLDKPLILCHMSTSLHLSRSICSFRHCCCQAFISGLHVSVQRSSTVSCRSTHLFLKFQARRGGDDIMIISSCYFFLAFFVNNLFWGSDEVTIFDYDVSLLLFCIVKA